MFDDYDINNRSSIHGILISVTKLEVMESDELSRSILVEYKYTQVTRAITQNFEAVKPFHNLLTRYVDSMYLASTPSPLQALKTVYASKNLSNWQRTKGKFDLKLGSVGPNGSAGIFLPPEECGLFPFL